MRSMSQSSISLGKARWAGSRTGEADSTGSQSALFQSVRRPRWVSWIITARRARGSRRRARRSQRHDLVAIGMQIAEGRRAVARDDRRARRHGQRDAALRLLDMVEPVALLRHAVLGIGRLVRRRHDPVLQREMLEPKWLKQRIICAVNGRHDENFALSRTVPQCEWPRHYGIARLQRDSPRGEIPQ